MWFCSGGIFDHFFAPCIFLSYFDVLGWFESYIHQYALCSSLAKKAWIHGLFPGTKQQPSPLAVFSGVEKGMVGLEDNSLNKAPEGCFNWDAMIGKSIKIVETPSRSFGMSKLLMSTSSFFCFLWEKLYWWHQFQREFLMQAFPASITYPTIQLNNSGPNLRIWPIWPASNLDTSKKWPEKNFRSM